MGTKPKPSVPRPNNPPPACPIERKENIPTIQKPQEESEDYGELFWLWLLLG